MAAQQANQTEVPQQELFQWQESHPEIHNKTTIYLHFIHTHTPVQWPFFRDYPGGWWRGTVVERRSLAGELSLSCARPAADG